MAEQTCPWSADIGDSDDPEPLICDLADGHDGPHYDKTDNITWKPGRP